MSMSQFMYINIMGPRAILVCVLIVWVAVFTPVSASKEVVNDEEVAVLAKRLYDEIKKRLNDYGEKVDGLQDVDMSKFSLQNETIIKTTSSLDNGAQFLNNSVVETREDCAKLCFANAHCNMAVFHSKKSFSCYLFNCGTPSVCKFSSHPAYVAMALSNRDTGLSEQKKHESDLANLSPLSPSVPTTTTTTTTTSTTATPAATTTTASTVMKTEPKLRKVEVPLFGKCGPLVGDCTDRYTECLTGICVCQEGFHEQEGACRKECDRFEFECTNMGRPLVYPQCIAVYDKCDGVAQCSDGSDELNCPIPRGPTVDKDHEKATNEHKNDEKTNKIKTLPPTIDVKSTIPPVKVVAVEPVKTSTDSAVTPKIQVTVKNDTTSTTGGDNKIIAHSKNVTGAAPTETQKIVSKPTIVEKIEEVIVIHEQGIGAAVVHHEVKSNRGAVVALGLGLAVTAVLLMFVGCRLRNMKRKLRRGRPMNSNEADYLINGMYL